MSDKSKIGLIGTGRIGQVHARTSPHSPRSTFVGL